MGKKSREKKERKIKKEKEKNNVTLTVHSGVIGGKKK